MLGHTTIIPQWRSHISAELLSCTTAALLLSCSSPALLLHRKLQRGTGLSWLPPCGSLEPLSLEERDQRFGQHYLMHIIPNYLSLRYSTSISSGLGEGEPESEEE